MKRFFVVLGLALGVLSLFGGCGISQEGGIDGADGGGSGGTGGTGVGGGTCFPGAKVCPDKKTGDLICLTADTPDTGCKNNSSCDPCITPHATAKCSSGKCAIDKCDAGFQDCNNDPTDGCEVDTANDPTHCGNCQTDCIATKGSNWMCDTGQCAVNDCVPPTTSNCDGDKTNGCEVDLLTDVNNCGYCTHKCALPHATSGCKATTSGTLIADCYVVQCDSGYANCDNNDANGCETNIATDPGNCGSCNNGCSTTNGVPGCNNGQCGILCNQGFGNCDNNAGNGCEVNLNTDPSHCGVCTTACNPQNAAAPACNSGACGYTACNSGFADCDGNTANGCEINTNTDTKNCGTCKNNCNPPSGGSAVCNGGTCGQSCTPPLTLCNGACVNFSSDVNNCGSCNNKCTGAPANSTNVCSGGSCGFSCNNGFAKCGSTTQCFNLSTDVNHCGACATVCPLPTSGTGSATCLAGGCGVSCSAPTPNKCGNGCFDEQTDNSHCGNCTTTCSTPKTCQTGSCKCPTGQTDCSGTCYDLTNTDSHCGSCGTSCTGGKTCQSSSCKCPTGQTDCSGTCYDLTNNDGHCGACGTSCTAPKTCQSSTCTCPSGQTDCSGTCANLQNDPANCNSCGHVCGSGASCTSGACTCSSGHYCGDATGCKACCDNTDCGGATSKCCTANGYVCKGCCDDTDCLSSEKCCNGSGQSFTCIAKSGTCT